MTTPRCRRPGGWMSQDQFIRLMEIVRKENTSVALRDGDKPNLSGESSASVQPMLTRPNAGGGGLRPLPHKSKGDG